MCCGSFCGDFVSVPDGAGLGVHAWVMFIYNTYVPRLTCRIPEDLCGLYQVMGPFFVGLGGGMWMMWWLLALGFC